ncbi:uncharacterized protein METZ01_LOCUS161291 [marine metagenome]|uniref:Uncharacterized protein n=1 Tax=marine metagenome TaxID=408172 RepID=A0A382B5D3_9ZZZZ
MNQPAQILFHCVLFIDKDSPRHQWQK